jgi:predicted nucleotidyltransferase component of viral defense system
MVAPAIVRQYASGQNITLEVADQEVVLHYALALLNQAGLVGRRPDGSAGPLLFKGGTALRKCVFGSTGRFSQDIDLDATRRNGFEAEIEEALASQRPFHGIALTIRSFRYSAEGNFSGTIAYEHEHGSGAFELQISYRLDPILEPVDLALEPQSYFRRVEFPPPVLHGLDPYEMIGEKLMACNRRLGGSGKDVYDLFLWSQRPFAEDLVRRLAVLKAWTDRRKSPTYEPVRLLAAIVPRSFRWTDLAGLVPRGLTADPEPICQRVRERFAFLAELGEDEQRLLADQTAHREHALFRRLRDEARARAHDVPR